MTWTPAKLWCIENAAVVALFVLACIVVERIPNRDPDDSQAKAMIQLAAFAISAVVLVLLNGYWFCSWFFG